MVVEVVEEDVKVDEDVEVVNGGGEWWWWC